MEEIMSPRVGLMHVDADGWPILPQTVHVTIGVQTVVAPVWSVFYALQIGGFPAREYRDFAHGRLAVVMKVADVTLPDGQPGAVAIAWVPSTDRVGSNATYDAVMASPEMAGVRAGQWDCQLDTDGTLVLPSLEADTSAAATVAKAAWPTGWRKQLSTDFGGTVSPPVPPDPPTGPLCIGAMLA